MRVLILGTALLGVAACSPSLPSSGAGTSYGSLNQYAREREMILQAGNSQGTTGGLPAADAVTSQPLSAMETLPAGAQTTAAAPAYGSDPEAIDIARETQAALQSAQMNSGVVPLQASPSNPPPEAVNAMGISQENNFEAVGEQRSIEQDKEFIAQNRAKYEQIAPTALPQRVDTGPNLVTYALQTSNPMGQRLYSRISIASESRFNRNCAKYPSPDLAQSDFLKKGGPERDRMGVDPDGDGYACSWDPAPFRKASGG
ncbi:hypothetical protein DL237_17305 [Pseudooceanicola sediminis]|uniref:Excalibur calcium-binding domain-containing protein n=2 Tax=Pseudooceanicola sediminis TaxID=2211117 RepID=A0A399IY99_9RHOB|nr:hypothetical protein E0K93_17545 [Puniceibacterium sp. HSS470]RII37427.1 hypothetical protein DL237_17305 [Pseudooceanicola sediminis]